MYVIVLRNRGRRCTVQWGRYPGNEDWRRVDTSDFNTGLSGRQLATHLSQNKGSVLVLQENNMGREIERYAGEGHEQ